MPLDTTTMYVLLAIMGTQVDPAVPFERPRGVAYSDPAECENALVGWKTTVGRVLRFTGQSFYVDCYPVDFGPYFFYLLEQKNPPH